MPYKTLEDRRANYHKKRDHIVKLHRVTQAAYRERNRDRIRKNSIAFYYRHKNEISEQTKKHRDSERMTVLQHYGMRCACCGESAYEFLAIDHIYGGGNKHRKSIKGQGSNSLSGWIIKHNFPGGFQILCHNCNMAKGIYGYCPHTKEIEPSAKESANHHQSQDASTLSQTPSSTPKPKPHRGYQTPQVIQLGFDSLA